MHALINRFFSEVERLFDDHWIVIWLLDDL